MSDSKESASGVSIGNNVIYFLRELWDFNFRIVIWGIIGSIAVVCETTFVNLLPKEIIRLVEGNASRVKLVVWILGLLILQKGCQSLYTGINYYMNDWGLRTRHYLEKKALTRYCNTDYANAENPKIRKLYQKAREVFGNWDQDVTMLMWNLQNFISNLIGIVFYAAVIITLNPMILVLLAANAWIVDRISKYHNTWVQSHYHEWEWIDRKKNYLQRVGMDFTYAKDIRLYQMPKWIENMYRELINKRMYWCKRMLGVYFWRGSLWWTVIQLVRNGFVYGVLMMLVVKGEITADGFVLYFAMITTLSEWISRIMDNVRNIRKCSLFLSDYRELLEYPDQYDYENGYGISDMEGKPCEITFENVSFAYEGAESSVLKSICVKIQPGEKIAIVGLNGAGKTTLIKNLCGLYKPTSGSIKINGIDSLAFKHKEYYKLFSVVFQDVNLLPGTVLENITLKKKEESDVQKAGKCLMQAGLWDKIESLPLGMDTYLQKDVFDNAVDLSGGEKQKLLLARAIYKDAPILILDEPTAALDPIAENKLYQSYHELTKERTSVYISHRLSSTQFCDRILFLKDGEIIEEGSHEELMAKKGEYAKLFEMQSYYYKNNSTEEYHSELDPVLKASGYVG